MLPETTKAASRKYCGGFEVIETGSKSTSRIGCISLVRADTDQLRPVESVHQVLKRVQIVWSVKCQPIESQ